MTLADAFEAPALAPIALDLYRDIHKGIRTSLFDLVVAAGSTDHADPVAVGRLAEQVRTNVDLLDLHAHHEDEAIAPAVEIHLPDLAEQIAADHEAFDGRGAYLVAYADHVAAGDHADGRTLLHHLYLDLAGFTSTYLAHQDVEERELMPALQAAVGPEAIGGIHGRILASIPPDEMARSLALMLPVMNLDDRSEMLGAMQQGAPAEVFQGVWGLAGSVLAPADADALGRRLGLV